jgi:hypothetical protein
VLAANAANVVLLDDEDAPAEPVLDDDEVPPQPLSTANMVSAMVTPVTNPRGNASTRSVSMAFCSLAAARATVAMATSLLMPPPSRTNL